MTVAVWVCLVAEAVLESHFGPLSYHINMLLRDYQMQICLKVDRKGRHNDLPSGVVVCGFDMVDTAKDDVKRREISVFSIIPRASSL
jgi:hypothetical protein